MVHAFEVSKVYRWYPGPSSLLKEIFLCRPSHKPFVALDKTSFQLQAGESLGIIGNNGAGKSTLLKILAGTCAPSTGQVQLQGRVASLLELGIGFDPEFTGRRNLYFSGALAGFSRDEIASRENRIISFSGLGDSIDWPVKTYSSGMYLRLAFSLATALDPDVLIIDEVLAVGDGSFQKKCLDRIKCFRDRGCTIVFSHAVQQIEPLCSQALWLHQGRVHAMGSARKVVSSYRRFCQTETENMDSLYSRKEASRKICWIEKVSLERFSLGKFETGNHLTLNVWARFLPKFVGTPGIGVAIVREDGVVVYATGTALDNIPLQEISPNLYSTQLIFPHLRLLAGNYSFNVLTTDAHVLQSYDLVEKQESFCVRSQSDNSGLFDLDIQWESE